ncbi:MAG: hypothetical protein Q4B26_20465 [Eubacteriales bacterium]|nr:hypothetical protein [Eubacteriales bacterium]
MKYTVLRIDEDIDFGCEERATDVPVMAVVTLTDENGAEMKLRHLDQMLYDRDINEGDTVILNEKNELQKPLDDDWTKNCTTKTVDIMKFVEMMQVVKAGKQVDWTCPFCGGKVGLMEQDRGHTVIGCDSCDMQINLDEN